MTNSDIYNRLHATRFKQHITVQPEHKTFNHQPRAALHRNAAVFQLIRAFDHILLPQKFHDDISNGSRVMTLTNKKHPQTNHNENTQLAMLQRVPLTYYRRDLLTRVYKATCLTVLGLRIELHSVFRVRPMGRRPGCRTAILPRHLERSNGQIVSGIGNYVREDEFTLS